MIEDVYILGAGASYDCGAPLMNNFLDKAEDLLFQGKFESERGKIDSVFKVMAELQNVHSKSFLDLNNIEVLLGALEIAGITKTLLKYEHDEIKNLKDSLTTLIVRTLEESIEFPYTDHEPKPTATYNRFCNLIQKRADKSAIITFNYDLALDIALESNQLRVDYCLGKIREKIRLLKLHGSLNWWETELGSIEPLPLIQVSNYIERRNRSEIGVLSLTKKIQKIKQYFINTGNPTKNDLPIIVPPTWNKTQYQGTLTNVWSEASKCLATAKNFYVFGYSLPETDSFFRYLYAIGSMGDSRIRKFWVFDPDNSGQVEKRFRNLLGKGIENRFQYRNDTFDKAIDYLNPSQEVSSITLLY